MLTFIRPAKWAERKRKIWKINLLARAWESRVLSSSIVKRHTRCSAWHVDEVANNKKKFVFIKKHVRRLNFCIFFSRFLRRFSLTIFHNVHEEEERNWIVDDDDVRLACANYFFVWCTLFVDATSEFERENFTCREIFRELFKATAKLFPIRKIKKHIHACKLQRQTRFAFDLAIFTSNQRSCKEGKVCISIRCWRHLLCKC